MREFQSDMQSIGVLMIATREYLGRWFDCAESIDKHLFKNQGQLSVSIHLFTDQVNEATEWGNIHLSRANLIVHAIESWGWPEVTLLRYRFFTNYKKYLINDILIYLDSDMLVLSNFYDLLQDFKWRNGMAFVPHPGFVMKMNISSFFQVAVHPKLLSLLLKEKLKKVLMLGSWEVNPKSLAYLIPSNRKKYVHGAIWMGKQADVIQMCSNLSERINVDLENKVIATWHDESHLNWYYSSGDYTLLSNLLSGTKRQFLLSQEKPRIITVNKAPHEGRSPS